ncbi:hypothetical protein [Amycolatopsis sp. FDAARGOS 1241]|uniref:hypothetical protein n=1 Tax=Amycolatopsis sp. FDAARGOS 1241 TaxID=2778070 RepID=UPI001EF2C973|nr:hypothetical protein [Amycolatopsis sp. FDAARGOS 1241]
MSSARLLRRFHTPGPEYSPLPIWWWSGAPVTHERLRRQLERLVEQSVRQAGAMCLAATGPMFGSVADDPPFLSPQWLELLDAACADAAELGFHLWMQDQIGFSGAKLQGRLTAEHPEYAGLALKRDATGIHEDDRPLGAVASVAEVGGPWCALAESTLDNSDGDLAAASRSGTLPIEVCASSTRQVRSWRRTARSPKSATPTDGGGRPSGRSRAGCARTRCTTTRWGPRVTCPKSSSTGATCRPAAGSPSARTSRSRTDGAVPRRRLARRVVVDGAELPVPESAYQSFSPLPDETAGRTVAVEIEFTATREGVLRASFAVVADPGAYRRPEWLVGEELVRTFTLAGIPDDTVVHVASEGACRVFVNDKAVGKQGDFNPYPGHREIRVHPYDVREHLRAGQNTLRLALTADAADTVDAPLSDTAWRSTGLRRDHPRDPRFVCAGPRPHPLRGAHWLEPGAAQGEVVLGVVPDLEPGGERTEHLTFPAPLGTTALTIPTTLDVRVAVGDAEYKPVEGRVALPAPLPAGTPIRLTFTAFDGRRGGALLDAAVQVEVAEAETSLAPWEDLGLRAPGGLVRYRTTITAPPGRAILDLGSVRGTADVLVNGELVDRLVWGPWRAELTDSLCPGENTVELVVRGTLAGYLDDASPTTAVAAGQTRTGLFGPVRLVVHEEVTG